MANLAMTSWLGSSALDVAKTWFDSFTGSKTRHFGEVPNLILE